MDDDEYLAHMKFARGAGAQVAERHKAAPVAGIGRCGAGSMAARV